MTDYAHSPKGDIPAQTYADHVNGVLRRAGIFAAAAAKYAPRDAELFRKVVRNAALFHDLGKLDAENQNVLSGNKQAERLPVHHQDAGCAYLLDHNDLAAAVLICSHHLGLPDFPGEINRDKWMFRDNEEAQRTRANSTLQDLLNRHYSAIPEKNLEPLSDPRIHGDSSIFLRMASACQVDADHTDTSVHYRECEESEPPPLKPGERLSWLDQYISELGNGDERSRMRAETYQQCRHASTTSSLEACDCPVGTGKTTAVMAHLLNMAAEHGLRRIFVVLPYTNIIRQSVNIYRKALLLPGENGQDVVAEVHHRADYQNAASRHLSALWKAPIIVTTAVNFFETLASCSPASLRKLHNLPGSAIFMDEAHAALPAKLLPLAWKWMKILAEEWSCHWVFASGSLNRFWTLEEVDVHPPRVENILPEVRSQILQKYESKRIHYCYHTAPLGIEDLKHWLPSLPGPRLLIVNTVQSAAAIARALHDQCPNSVQHLSTSLCPKDRETRYRDIEKRLEILGDTNWTLVATSCVEAGVDLSFKTGLREIASLVSLLQVAGRVNRQGSSAHAEVWSIMLKEGFPLLAHPGLRDSASVLKSLLDDGKLISPSLCTEAFHNEIRLHGGKAFAQALLHDENRRRFPKVQEDFKVIPSETRTVVVEPELIDKLERHEKVDWQAIQSGSVQIWGNRLDRFGILPFAAYPEIFKWTLKYDSFLGYMAGVLESEEFRFHGGIL